MAKFKGRSFLVKRGDGGGPEVFTTIGNMRSTSASINNEVIDVTDKDSGQWRQLLSGGIKSMEISLAGVFSDDATLENMIARAMSSDGTDTLNFQIVSAAGDIFSGAFQITSLERAGEFNNEETYSLKLTSAGTITYTAAP